MGFKYFGFKNIKTKLGLSCTKLSTAEVSYQLAGNAFSASCCWSWKLGWVKLRIFWLGASFTLAWAPNSVSWGWIGSGGLAELQHSARLVKDFILKNEQKLWIKVVWLVVSIRCGKSCEQKIVNICWWKGSEQNSKQELWRKVVNKSFEQNLLAKVVNKRCQKNVSTIFHLY